LKKSLKRLTLNIINKHRNTSHIIFARNCIQELVSKPTNNGLTQISDDDLIKIETILNRYKKKDNYFKAFIKANLIALDKTVCLNGTSSFISSIIAFVDVL